MAEPLENKDTGAPEEEKAEDGSQKGTENDQNDNEGTDDKGDEQDEDDEKDDENEKSQKGNSDRSQDDDPPVRRSALSHIIQRKNEKIERLQRSNRSEGDGDGKGDQNVELTQAGRRVIEEILDERLGSVLDHVRQGSDEQELQEVFAKHPEARKIERTLRKYMNHPSYRDVPLEFIYRGLAASAGTQAGDGGSKGNRTGRENRSGGHMRRKSENDRKAPDFSKMSDEEIVNIGNQVMTGQYNS